MPRAMLASALNGFVGIVDINELQCLLLGPRVLQVIKSAGFKFRERTKEERKKEKLRVQGERVVVVRAVTHELGRQCRCLGSMSEMLIRTNKLSG